MRIELHCPTCNKPLLVESETITGTILSERLHCGHTRLRFLTPAEIKSREFELANRPTPNTCTAVIKRPCFALTGPISVAEFISAPVTSTAIEVSTKQAEFASADTQLTKIYDAIEGPDNWKALRQFQRDGVLFGERSNIRFVLADEPGLGKTPQFTVLLDRNFAQMTPCLLICPPSITTHWERFLVRWLQKDKYDNAKPHRTINVHRGRNKPILDGYDVTIIGNNLLTGEFTKQSIIDNGYQSLCIDECHHFKSDKAQRTGALIEFAQYIPHIVALSGTPIMNCVDEYFPILHIIKPEHWPTKLALNNICEKNSRGMAMQIRPQYRDWFFNRTSKYIIRRKKSEHLPGLPQFTRIPEFLNPESLNPVAAKRFANAYNMLADQLEKALAEADHGNILGLLSTIRRITGEAKAQAGVEYALDLLDSDEEGNEKLIIGVHHKNTAVLVKHFLERAASERNDPSLIPLFMDSSQDSAEKDAIQFQFGKKERRVLVASILACAEGRDGLQHICSRQLILEREWNPAKEEQFEQRLDRFGQTVPVQAIYFMMLQTVDEWFHELVELKRNIVNSTFDKTFEVDSNLMRDLAQKVVRNRMKIIGI